MLASAGLRCSAPTAPALSSRRSAAGAPLRAAAAAPLRLPRHLACRAAAGPGDDGKMVVAITGATGFVAGRRAPLQSFSVHLNLSRFVPDPAYKVLMLSSKQGNARTIVRPLLVGKKLVEAGTGRYPIVRVVIGTTELKQLAMAGRRVEEAGDSWQGPRWRR